MPGLINTLAYALELDPEFSEARDALQAIVIQVFKWKVPQPPADLAPRAAGAGTGDGDLRSDTPPTPNIETSPEPPEVEEHSLAWEMLQHDIKEANKRRYKDSLAYRALELTKATYANNLTDWRQLEIETKVDDRVIFGEPKTGKYGIEIGIRGSHQEILGCALHCNVYHHDKHDMMHTMSTCIPLWYKAQREVDMRGSERMKHYRKRRAIPEQASGEGE